MTLHSQLHRCGFYDTHVGFEVGGWISILTNAFWLCASAMGWGTYSVLLTFHAIVGIILGASLKGPSRKEHTKRYGTFLAVNGVFVAFEVVMLIWLVFDFVVRVHLKSGELWYMEGEFPPLLPGSAQGIIYMLVEIPLNVIIEFCVRVAYKCRGTDSVLVTCLGRMSGRCSVSE